MEIYGSLVNRIYESNYKDGKIEIGTGVTELGYSDRTPYYVVGINLYPKTSKYKGEIRSLVIAEAKVKKDDWTVGTGEVLPFEELLARIRSILRRVRPVHTTEQLTVRDIRIDPNAYEVFFEGKKLELTRKEYDLLKRFIEVNIVFSKVLTTMFNHLYG